MMTFDPQFSKREEQVLIKQTISPIFVYSMTFETKILRTFRYIQMKTVFVQSIHRLDYIIFRTNTYGLLRQTR